MQEIQDLEIKEEELLLSEENGHQDQTLPPANLNYTYASTIEENEAGSDISHVTWCVDFAYRPNVYRMSKPGTWIKQLVKKRSQMNDKNFENETRATNEQTLDLIATSSWINMFATVSAHTVRVYHAELGAVPELLVAFRDTDEEETFYTCTWTYNADGRKRWWVLAAGDRGVVRVLDVAGKSVIRSLIGHGNSVNDLVVHPNDPALLLSASKDESIRMWNLRTGATIAVFAGVKGHRGEVVAVDFNRQGHSFVSCGIDYSIRVWNIDDDIELMEGIVKSHEIAEFGTNDGYFYWDRKERVRKRIKTMTRMFPVFITRKLHKNYVDCIRFIGDTFISKSIHNRLLLVKPDINPESPARPSSNYTILREFPVDGCGVWFIRFGVDRTRRLIAIGDEQGGINVFNVDSQLHEEYPKGNKIQPPHADALTASRVDCYVRKCAFNEDATMIVSVDDLGYVVIYERKHQLSS